MAYKNKRYRQLVDLQSSPLEDLELALPRAQSDVLKCKNSLNELTIEEIRSGLKEVNAQIEFYDMAVSLYNQPAKDFSGFFLGTKQYQCDESTRLKFWALHKQREPLWGRRSDLLWREKNLPEKAEALKIAESWLLRLEAAISSKRKQKNLMATRQAEAISQERKKKEKHDELRAAAAANVKETRDLGANVRRGLAKNHSCPYCGGSNGSDSHADHIYPVSKGGRSVPKNMVFVCAKCNIMKTNLTLTAFIKKYTLDRDAIEERLSKLHKDF